MFDQRPSYLSDWARRLEAAAVRGAFGKPIGIKSATPISGPRAAVLLLYCGIDSGALLRGLQADDCATLRQLIPFEFSGEPQCFMAERAVRVEVGWPSGLADDNIPLHTLGQHPINGGRWLIGRNERGDVPTGILDDMIPHWLISGQTGSGKSTALVSTVGQLSQDTHNRLVLIDAKHGASFRPLAEARGLVGPLADDVTSARSALGWCVREMAERYTGGRDDRRLVIVIDELQAIVTDDGAAKSLRRLVEQGRGARIHVIAATQHPVVQALGGPTVGRNLVGRLALRVSDADASRVAVGASWPRADHLLGKGDAYLVKPSVVHRCQVAWWDGRIAKGVPDLAEWPEESDNLPELVGWPSGDEVGAAIVSASRNEGRTRFVRSLTAAGLAGMSPERAVKLLKLARGALEYIESQGAAVRSFDVEDTRENEPDDAI